MNHYHLIEINFIFLPFFNSHDDLNPQPPSIFTQTNLPPTSQHGQVHWPGKARPKQPNPSSIDGWSSCKKTMAGSLEGDIKFSRHKRNDLFFVKSGFFSRILTWTYVYLKHKKGKFTQKTGCPFMVVYHNFQGYGTIHIFKNSFSNKNTCQSADSEVCQFGNFDEFMIRFISCFWTWQISKSWWSIPS